MKKAILLIAGIAFLAACGGGKNAENEIKDTLVTPQMKEIQKSSDSVKAKSDELNKKADSLLKNI